MLKQIQTSLLEIAYEERGEENAVSIIFAHGFPDDVRTWDKVVEPLVAEGFRTLAPYTRGYGKTSFLDDAMRSGEYVALAQDIIEFADALGLDKFIFVGHDWGAAAGYLTAILYPERVQSLVALAAGYGMGLPGYAHKPVPLDQIRAYWYQWHFNLEKGRITLASERRKFCRELWKIWSPSWNFDSTTFDETAKSFDNPDFVDVVIHSYRRRWDNASSDSRYKELEAKLVGEPKISVPTITIVGAEDGATLAESSEGKEQFFTGGYERRVLNGIGHFIQREKPEAVIEAVEEMRKTH